MADSDSDQEQLGTSFKDDSEFDFAAALAQVGAISSSAQPALTTATSTGKGAKGKGKGRAMSASGNRDSSIAATDAAAADAAEEARKRSTKACEYARRPARCYGVADSILCAGDKCVPLLHRLTPTRLAAVPHTGTWTRTAARSSQADYGSPVPLQPTLNSSSVSSIDTPTPAAAGNRNASAPASSTPPPRNP